MFVPNAKFSVSSCYQNNLIYPLYIAISLIPSPALPSTALHLHNTDPSCSYNLHLTYNGKLYKKLPVETIIKKVMHFSAS